MTTTKGTPKSTAANVFLHLLMFLSLYVAVIFLIRLVFGYVDTAYPPLFSYFTYVNNSIIIAVSAILVVWPLYVVMAWLVGRWHMADAKTNTLRRWITYITLLAAAITIIIDLVVLVYNFLSGGLTFSFGVKTLSVLIITGAVFAYYLWDVRREYKKMALPKVSLIIATILVVGAIVTGFFVVGTPSEQRAQRYDDTRVWDLQNIQSEIYSYFQSKDKLPATLDELRNDITGFVAPQDPETKVDYEYIVLGENTFNLCTTFNKEAQLEMDQNSIFQMMYISGSSENWSHAAGRFCYERTIDPDLLNTVINSKTETVENPLR